MRKIAFINEKGGTGKTTLAVNVAASFALHQDKKVVLVDLDTQGHGGKSLGVDAREATPNVFHLLTDPRVSLDDVLRPTAIDSLFVIPSYKQMADFPLAVASVEGRERLLHARVGELAARGFDVVVFDSPPSLGLTSKNILMAAEEVVVPVALTYFSLDGCAEVVSTVCAVATAGRPHALPEDRPRRGHPRKAARILPRERVWHAAVVQRQDRRGPESRQDHLGVLAEEHRREDAAANRE
jgi:chromosome partitioning protein